MPTRYKSKSGIRWRGVVKMDGRVAETRLFGTGPAAKREAAQWELDRRKELERQTETPSDLPSVLDWANKYLAYSEQNHAQKTFKAKMAVFKSFLSFAKHNDLASIAPPLAMNYLHIQSKSRSGHAANKDRKNLAAAWKWGESYINGFPKTVNPFLAVSKLRESRKPRYIPPVEDFWKLVETAAGQDRTMLLTALYTGARRNEIFQLKWEDIDFINNRIRLGTQKTKDGAMRYDWLPLLEELKPHLLQWKEKRPYKSSQWVFTILDDTPSPHNNPGDPYKYRAQFMPRLCRRAGIKPFGFHAVRHLHALVLYNNGSSLKAIQTQLRHGSPTATARYVKTLGIDAEHSQTLNSIFTNITPKPAAVLEFKPKEDPQGGLLEGLVHRLGTQT